MAYAGSHVEIQPPLHPGLAVSSSSMYAEWMTQEIASIPPTGEPSARYYVVRGSRHGVRGLVLTRGIPDEASPHNADKDRRDGLATFNAEGTAFWKALKDAGYAWVARDFKRFWVWDTALAAMSDKGR
jgi:hypothetical protein